MKNQPVQISIKGNTVYISAYINFTGDANDKFGNTGKTYADLAIEGIKNNWNTSFSGSDYDFSKGLNGSIVTEIVSMVPDQSYYNTPDQRYFQANIDNSDIKPRLGYIGGIVGGIMDSSIDVNDRTHVSHCEDNVNKWSVKNPGRMTLFKDEKGNNYSEDQYKWVASHEFGHILGLGDAYKTPLSKYADETEEVTITDIMRSFWGTVSSNNIEMVLEAYKTNSWQRFTDFDGYNKSDAIKFK